MKRSDGTSGGYGNESSYPRDLPKTEYSQLHPLNHYVRHHARKRNRKLVDYVR